MRDLFALILIFLSMAALMPAQEMEIVGLGDIPQLFPPYYARARQIGLQGLLEFTLHFDAGKVYRVVLVEERLRSSLSDPTAHRMECESLLQGIEAVLGQWTSAYKTSFTVQTRVVLRLDNELDHREYHLKFGNRGVISELVMISPPLQPGSPNIVDKPAKPASIPFYASDKDRLAAALALFRFDIGRCPRSLEELIEKQDDERWAGPYLERDFPLQEFDLDPEKCSIERKRSR